MSIVDRSKWLPISFVILLASCGLPERARNHFIIYPLEYEGRYDELIDLYKKDLAKGKYLSPSIYLRLSHAYLCKRDYQNARQYLLEGLQRFPEDGHVMWNAGKYYTYIEGLCDKGLEFLFKAREVYRTSDWKLLIEEDIRIVERLSVNTAGGKHCRAEAEDYLRLSCVPKK